MNTFFIFLTWLALFLAPTNESSFMGVGDSKWIHSLGATTYLELREKFGATKQQSFFELAAGSVVKEYLIDEYLRGGAADTNDMLVGITAGWLWQQLPETPIKVKGSTIQMEVKF